jgi:hypothetical protein
MQLELNLALIPKREKGKRPIPEYPLRSDNHLRMLVEEEKQYMIFLYGQNPHICFIRDHSSVDNGTNYPIMRKDAMKILGNKYYHHGNHIPGPGEKAKVYIRRAK